MKWGGGRWRWEMEHWIAGKSEQNPVEEAGFPFLLFYLFI